MYALTPAAPEPEDAEAKVRDLKAEVVERLETRIRSYEAPGTEASVAAHELAADIRLVLARIRDLEGEVERQRSNAAQSDDQCDRFQAILAKTEAALAAAKRKDYCESKPRCDNGDPCWEHAIDCGSSPRCAPGDECWEHLLAAANERAEKVIALHEDAEDVADAERTRALWESRTESAGGDRGFVKFVQYAAPEPEAPKPLPPPVRHARSAADPEAEWDDSTRVCTGCGDPWPCVFAREESAHQPGKDQKPPRLRNHSSEKPCP